MGDLHNGQNITDKNSVTDIFLYKTCRLSHLITKTKLRKIKMKKS